jgi:hypothetical protein
MEGGRQKGGGREEGGCLTYGEREIDRQIATGHGRVTMDVKSAIKHLAVVS